MSSLPGVRVASPGKERHEAGLNASVECSLLQQSASTMSVGPPIPPLPDKVDSERIMQGRLPWTILMVESQTTTRNHC